MDYRLQSGPDSWVTPKIRKNKTIKTEPERDYGIQLPKMTLKSNTSSNSSGKKLKQFFNYLNYSNIEQSLEEQMSRRKSLTKKSEKEITQLRIQVKLMRDELKTRNKLSRQLETLESAIKNTRRPTYMQPIVPMYPPWQQPYRQSRQHSQYIGDYEEYPRQQRSSKVSKMRRGRKYNRSKNREQLRRRFRKIGMAVLFTIFLKKYSKKISSLRQKYFYSFWPANLKGLMNEARSWAQNQARQFYMKMLQSSNVDFSIVPDEDNKRASDLKSSKCLQFTSLFFQCLLKSLQKNGVPHSIAKLIHGFCKHGAFLAKGVLTRQEIKLSSFSEKQGYCRMNQQLQRVQIIHFFFIKLFLFNSLLRLQSYTQFVRKQLDNEQQENMKSNIFSVSSVIYHICLQLRDTYLFQNQRNEGNYPLNNWLKCEFMDPKSKTHEKISCCQSLRYQFCSEQDKDDGEMISGLMKIETFQEFYHPPQKYSKQEENLKKLIDLIHSEIKLLHREYKKKAQQ